MERNSGQYRYYEKEQRRARKFRSAGYVLLGLLVAVTAVVVFFALTKYQ